MLRNVFNYFKNRPGLSILVIILGIITFANLKPDLYLAGWDNYSSYFNLKTNIFRTFFSTWREYRGLGVPSDSESTDTFRQIFFLALSPLVKQQLLDQIYVFFSLNLGVILMYFLAGKLAHYIKGDDRFFDLGGTVSAFFYLFNLNTLATFYFPMIMFINRFYTVPLLILLLVKFFEKKRLVAWQLTLLIIGVIASSGSYLTATVFITVLMFLVLFLFFHSGNLKKAVIALVMFLLLNCFWFLPFINYTINRSGAVNLAPTFIEANEIQLNKPKSFYTIEKLLILYPNFFDTPISKIDRQQEAGYHPLVPMLNEFPYRQILWIFPLLYVVGSFYLLANFKKTKRILWIPASMFLFLFLSMKEFSPLGFVYIFLENTIPFFGNIFRFADTKFHYFVSFSGSLTIGFLAVAAWQRIGKKSLNYLAIIVAAMTIFVFKDYLMGDFFGFFERNTIPKAYFEIATVLNADKDDGRVLHLPFDKNIYWRSYNWGYLGSSFLHFMIDRPVIEKTFEPGSRENALLNDEIFRLIANSQSATANNNQTDKTREFYNLLKKTGIKYLIFDSTVSSEQPTKGITLWGRFNVSDSKQMVENLENTGLINVVADYPVDLIQFMDGKKVFPLGQEHIDEIYTNPYYSVRLYEVADVDPKIRVIRNIIRTDPAIANFNTNPDVDYFQTGSINEGYMTEPFKRRDVVYNFENGRLSFTLDDFQMVAGKTYKVSFGSQNAQQLTQNLVKVYAKKDEENLYLSFYRVDFPDIESDGWVVPSQTKFKEISLPMAQVSQFTDRQNRLDKYFSNWQILPYGSISDLRLKVGETVVPLPSDIGPSDTYVGSLLVNAGPTQIQALVPDSDMAIDANKVFSTEKPNCFDDGLLDYNSSLSKNDNYIILESRNGSTCLTASLEGIINSENNYTELSMDYESQSEDLDRQYALKYKNTSKPILREKVLSLKKTNYLYACMRDANLDECFNFHPIVDLKDSDTIIFPAEKQISALNPIMFFALKNTGFQKQSLKINKLSARQYKTILKDQFEIQTSNSRTITFKADSAGPLRISFDKPLNSFSFYQNSGDGFYVSNGTCTRPESYRTFRKDNNGNLISYFENCDNNLFQIMDFDSNNFYIWSVDYNSASGKYPRMVLGDGLFNYVDQYLSLWQGYPNVPGFKTFQHPEFFQTVGSVDRNFNKLKLVNTGIFIPSNPAYTDYKRKNFTVSHNSENEGLALFNNFNVMAIPNQWENLLVDSEENILLTDNSEMVNYSRILPSLWKVGFEGSADKVKVVYFNEAFDSQWGVYENIFDLVVGRESSLAHYRCNGYANCFEIDSNPSRLYIFYQPERLYFLGWLVTLGAVFLGKRMFSA